MTASASSAMGKPFTREREADSGLIFIGTRYYDPSVGRFISQDLAQWGVNWYGYAANNPASAFDANGNLPVPLITGAIGAVGGAIIGGVGAWLNGDNVWAGIGQGALVGGIAGATGGWIGSIVGGAVSGGAGIAAGVGGGMVAGAAEGVVGDIAAQAVSNVLGWQDGWNWGQTVGSGAIGAVTGGIGGYIGTIGQSTPPSRIYSARELMRRAEAPGPYHNSPGSFDEAIFQGQKTVVSPNYILYTRQGAINGVEGTFEIGVRPSPSGKTEVIVHRFFRPNR